MYLISKDFTFSASHQLAGLPDDHPCARVHGHNYVVRVELAADRLDHTGFVLDYRALAPVKTWIDTRLDHHHLNTVPELDGINPTAENLARHLHQLLPQLLDLTGVDQWAVAVSETPKTWARYQP